MALETQIISLGIDETGRLINLQNTTGEYNAITNPGGFGTPNPSKSQVNSIIVTLSHYDSPELYQVRFVYDQDPAHPEYIYSPNTSQILNGEAFNINSLILGITDIDEGLANFLDGVLDINMYTVMQTRSGIVGNEGDMFITGTNLDIISDTYNSIIIEDNIYQINHAIPYNAGTALYLTEPLKEDTTSFRPAYRANTKVYNSSGSDCCITEGVGVLSLSECCDDSKDKKVDTLFRVSMYKIAAQIEFNSENYEKSNDLLKAAYKGCKCLNCGC